MIEIVTALGVECIRGPKETVHTISLHRFNELWKPNNLTTSCQSMNQ